jgi:hypothetical protein
MKVPAFQILNHAITVSLAHALLHDCLNCTALGRKEARKMAVNSSLQREEEIERLAAQTGRLIREAEPASRAELAEAASTILREEALTGQGPERPREPVNRRPVNPLAAGIGILLVGAGLTLLFPLVGIGVMACGAIAIVWGAIISVLRK